MEERVKTQDCEVKNSLVKGFKPLSNNSIVDWSKLKAFADDKIRQQKN